MSQNGPVGATPQNSLGFGPSSFTFTLIQSINVQPLKPNEVWEPHYNINCTISFSLRIRVSSVIMIEYRYFLMQE